MLLRIFLILTILAGIGTIAITQFKVRPHIQGIIDERNRQTQRAEVAESSLRKTKKQLADTEGELHNTKKNLDDTQTQLASTKNQLNSERTRANGLQKNLEDTRRELRSTQQQLSAWDALGIPVETVKALIEAEKKLRVEIEALTEEKRIINEELTRALGKIKIYEQGRGEDFEIPLPPGIRGQVMVVDPKWRFVVLNVGSEDKVEENGVLLVSRKGKLVAKLKIARVSADRSIANVMPGWSFGQIREGDDVLN